MIVDGNHDSDVEHRSGDFRTRERLNPLVNVQSNIVAMNEQNPVVGIREDHKVIELLVNQLLQPTQNEIPSEDRVNRPTAVGPVCFSCGCEGHGINRCPRMNAVFPFLPSGWSVHMNNELHERVKRRQILQETRNGPGGRVSLPDHRRSKLH